jgi:hypothetical protein
MNSKQLHEYKYLLSRLDDDDPEIEITKTLFREALKHPKPARHHWIEGPEEPRLIVTPRFIIQIMLATLVVSLSSLLAAMRFPLALVAMPIYFLYCVALVVIRMRMDKSLRT